jgi:hypothetical protein
MSKKFYRVFIVVLILPIIYGLLYFATWFLFEWTKWGPHDSMFGYTYFLFCIPFILIFSIIIASKLSKKINSRNDGAIQEIISNSPIPTTPVIQNTVSVGNSLINKIVGIFATVILSITTWIIFYSGLTIIPEFWSGYRPFSQSFSVQSLAQVASIYITWLVIRSYLKNKKVTVSDNQDWLKKLLIKICIVVAIYTVLIFLLVTFDPFKGMIFG